MYHSHSVVPGGLDVKSYITRDTPGSSLIKSAIFCTTCKIQPPIRNGHSIVSAGHLTGDAEHDHTSTFADTFSSYILTYLLGERLTSSGRWFWVHTDLHPQGDVFQVHTDLPPQGDVFGYIQTYILREMFPGTYRLTSSGRCFQLHRLTSSGRCFPGTYRLASSGRCSLGTYRLASSGRWFWVHTDLPPQGDVLWVHTDLPPQGDIC